MEKAIYMNGRAGLLSDLISSGEPLEFERVYFGHEICDRLLFSEKEVEQVCRAAEIAKVMVTLVTPVNVSDMMLDNLGRILDKVSAKDVLDEIVFNDWGVLELLGYRKRWQPVMGRALNRIKRDPREGCSSYNGAELSLAQSGSITNHVLLNFLRSKGVARAEFDNVPQGVDIGEGLPISASLFWPIIPVAFSPICIPGASGQEGKEKFAVNGRCMKECLDYKISVPAMGVDIFGKCSYMFNDSMDNLRVESFNRLVWVSL